MSDGRNVYQAFGPGFTLLALDAAATSVNAFQTAATRMGLPLHTVVDNAQGERQRYQAPLVLVRPDQFVAWVGDAQEVSVETALGVLRQVSGG